RCASKRGRRRNRWPRGRFRCLRGGMATGRRSPPAGGGKKSSGPAPRCTTRRRMARDAAETRELKDSVAEYLKKSKFDKAAELLEELAAAEPKDMQHRLRLGDCYRRLGDPQKSVAQYEAAARHFAEEGQLIKAIAAVKIVLEIDPRNSAAQKQLAGMNRQRRLGKTSPDLTSRAERSAAAPQARGASVAEAIEAIELADEPPAPAASGTVVTDKLPPAPSRGAQRGAMADRIQ